MTGSGLGDGCAEASAWSSAATSTACRIALVAFGRDVALGHDPLGLAGLLERAAMLSQHHLGLGPAVARAGHRVAVALELGERQLALVECRLSLRDGLLGDLEPARVPVAAGAQVMERPVELLARAARFPGRRR